MQIKVNKEIREYTEAIFVGLTMRQRIFSILACVVAVIVYFLSIDKLGMKIISWLCILGTLPFASLGFIIYQQMNAETIVLTVVQSFLLSKAHLIDKPCIF